MGFRNPLTSAVDLDTGQPTGPGVRLYQDTTGEFPRGVLELRTGLSGDSPARVELTSFQVTDPDGSIRSLGNSLGITGSAANGVTPPSLDLDVAAAPAGGYRAVATLVAELIALVGPVTAARVLLGTRGQAIAHAPVAALLGGALPADAVPILRTGSVVVSTGGASTTTVNWEAFPNGLIQAAAWPGDTTGNPGTVAPINYALNGMNARVLNPAGAALPNTVMRLNYVATGW